MKKTFFALVLAVTIIAGSLFFSYKKAEAQAPFGGLIYFVKPCQCPYPGFLIFVSGPVPAVVLYTFGSILYPNGQLFYPGNWALGLYTPAPASCGMVQNGYCAAQVPAQGFISIVGTS